MSLFSQKSEIRSPYGELSQAEKQVILHAGTERPFSGAYVNKSDTGVYCCRNCGAPLYVSDDKFDSNCGWPAFDSEIPDAVRRIPDPDGSRTEIRCSACGGHLGHVFEGERLTARDTRHCVNSVSLRFEDQKNSPRIRRAVFAGGCFWGVEALMRSQKGVVSVLSGYTGGKVNNPDYGRVCTGNTGHAEAVEVFYDPARTTYEALCRYFLEIHDPTQRNRQGPDVGTQYRSAVFYLDPEQFETASKLLKILRGKGLDVQTSLEPFVRFWPAEEYHQDYYGKKGVAPSCHGWKKRF